MRRYAAYYRVSTDKQGRSGLGLDAQKEAVKRFINGGSELVGEFVEVESGKKADRPELLKAINVAKMHGATLLIAKLDRLARNVAFIANLMDSGVEFTACDMPNANRLTVHILAAVAEHEAKAISERTGAALRAAKARGVQLGSPKGSTRLVPHAADAATKSVKVRQEKADAFAAALAPILSQLKDEGFTSNTGIAKELNRRGIQTPRGGQWHPTAVQRILSRS
jgi:DNA invertase Pin-like site-specific DNA recombinase